MGYFHSSFVQAASLDLRIKVREYFAVLLSAAQLILSASRDGSGKGDGLDGAARPASPMSDGRSFGELFRARVLRRPDGLA